MPGERRARLPIREVSDLAQALSTHASPSNLLDKIEKAGLIRRERKHADHHVVQPYFTAAGELALKKAPQRLPGIQGEVRRADLDTAVERRRAFVACTWSSRVATPNAAPGAEPAYHGGAPPRCGHDRIHQAPATFPFQCSRLRSDVNTYLLAVQQNFARRPRHNGDTPGRRASKPI